MEGRLGPGEQKRSLLICMMRVLCVCLSAMPGRIELWTLLSFLSLSTSGVPAEQHCGIYT